MSTIILEHNRKALATLAGLSASGRLPHTLLIEAPAGCGKKTMARLICQYMLCIGKTPPCGVCAHCVKVQKDVHPDVRFYKVPEGKKEFPVDLVRELRQDAYIAPNEGACKVYVIDQAHTMNTAAQNAILKIIEEPPAFVRFVLLCENRSLMLPTILSRAVCMELEMPAIEQCIKTLARLAPDASDEERAAAAQGAAGNIGQALGLMGTAKPSKAAADSRRLRQVLIAGGRYEALRILAAYDKDREGLLQMLTLLQSSFASLAGARFRASAPEEEKLLCDRVTARQAAGAAQAVREAHIRAGRNAGIPLLCACMIEEVKSALSMRD